MLKIVKIFSTLFLLFFQVLVFSQNPEVKNKNGLVYFYGYPFNTESEILQISRIPAIIRAEISIEWKDVFIDRDHYDWDFIDRNIEIWNNQGKTVILRFMTANNSTYSTSPKLIDQERIRLVGEGLFSDFENDTKKDGYELVKAESVAENFTLMGKNSVGLVSNTETNCTILQTIPGTKFNSSATYLVQFDYKILGLIDKREAGNFRIVFKSNSKEHQTISKTLRVKAGELSLCSNEIKLDSSEDYSLSIEAENMSDCLIDNINVIQSSDSRGRRVAFPNYFSPNFKSAYICFMKELAKKYGNNPAVDAIAVSGIGRWEEMLLNANEEGILDVQESIFRQWKAFGYTDVNYLKDVVEWSIDLSLKYFPNKEHILQISPMNNGYVNEDFIYRRAASIAVSKGVSIKQNGMSEKYDTWAATSDPSFMMNRYRYRITSKRYYETGGQIYTNTLKAMGHPLSLFNRVAIDGVNYLFLYKGDILEPNVQKYFAYFDSLIQKPAISKLYTDLGNYPLANRKKRMPNILDTVVYQNNWLGIRQYEDAEANADYVIDEKTQKKGVKTNADNPKILFDIDDRVMYNGMSNPILTVEYLDAGTDAFSIDVLNRYTGLNQNVCTILKTNTGTFLNKSIALGRSLDVFENHKEVKPEIVILDNRDGYEFISSVVIDFVPVNEFKMSAVSESKATEKPLVLNDSADKLQREIPLSCNKPVSKAEFVYFDDDFGTKTDIYGSLQLIDDKNTREVSRKQYYIGGDKEVVPLPVADYMIPRKAILNVFSGNGKVGAYSAIDGELAYRLFSFENRKSSDFVFEDGYLDINDFFNGFEINSSKDIKNIEIKKILPDLSELNIEFSVSGNILYFQPQTKGKYRILHDNKTLNPVSVCELVRR